MQKILKYSGLFLLILTALFLLTCNHALAGLVASFAPAAFTWVFVGLLLIEVTAFYWLWRGIFGRQDHLIFNVTDPKAQEQLKNKLVKRLKENSHIKEANLDPELLEGCLVLLNQKADEEIQRTAKGIFLTTALSQNGRIDAIIVFVGLCRMVWNISSIYNQRPHPLEVLRLYRIVAISTFLAYSIEELDIASEVSTTFGELLGNVTPSIVAAGIPLVGRALQRFTASAFDGATNCFLALRTGIITRNAYAYILDAEKERLTRASIFRDAGKMLSSICSEPIKYLIKEVTTGTEGIVTAFKLMFTKRLKKLVEPTKTKPNESSEEVDVVPEENTPSIPKESKTIGENNPSGVEPGINPDEEPDDAPMIESPTIEETEKEPLQTQPRPNGGKVKETVKGALDKISKLWKLVKIRGHK